MLDTKLVDMKFEETSNFHFGRKFAKISSNIVMNYCSFLLVIAAIRRTPTILRFIPDFVSLASRICRAECSPQPN